MALEKVRASPSAMTSTSLLNSPDLRFVARDGIRASKDGRAGGLRGLLGTKLRWDQRKDSFRQAPHEMPVEAKFGGKRSGQPLLTAKETERNRLWKGKPLARWKRMQRAVWRTRAPILKSWARRVSIWAERQG